ncbi:hypothetical protein E2562_015839 [Oryza meyeriana var. granulata]|uniref:Methyltransferase type 11 domain-containing protein n=1 Tax=Oryza meyeriana var. granulata TaxID=110450 RepID=A0A6G1D4P6_9ORYZ|nr:hypothetical protein E2562_015839 [Oryza meyeriana var. granulata]
MTTALFLRGGCLVTPVHAAAPALRRGGGALVQRRRLVAVGASSSGDGVTTTADAVLRGADGSSAAKPRGYGLVGGANGAIAPPATAKSTAVETTVERVIFDFRFLALLAVAGSLAGSLLCFLNGCVYIKEAYSVYWTGCLKGVHTGQMVLKVVEAIDVYLAGTVMLIFGMGLYGLFISNTSTDVPSESDRALQGSSLFGMFALKERPKWMKITSLDELKTKVGHVIVMILLVKMFERSKMVKITTGLDLLSYSYWDARYVEEGGAPYDWYQRYAALRPFVRRFAPPDYRILMIGCGSALMSEDMVDDGYMEIINIDISSVVIEIMRKKHFNIPQLQYMQMDVRDMSVFPDESFDCAIDKGTLDSLMCGVGAPLSAAQMVLEVERLLKPGGIFMLITYGDPSVRVPHLNQQGCNWKTVLYILPRPGFKGKTKRPF